MAVPRHQPTPDECKQRVEIQLSPEQYLTVIVKHDSSISIDRFQQSPEVEGVEQHVLDLLTAIDIEPDGTVFVIVDSTTE